MANGRNPWDIPEWRALSRESSLVRHLVGSGATALGRANYADQTGEYYTAFFGLSVGLERLAKLILVTDHALLNKGELPQQSVVSQFGHELSALMDAAEAVQLRHAVNVRYPRPQTEISKKIIECLDAFADARRGRYANFAALGDPNLGDEFEPIRKWWTEVAELILQEHYYGKPAQKRIEDSAQIVATAMSGYTSVLYVNETGDAMQDLHSASARTGQTELVQKFGRYYTLTIVRWLSDLFSELSFIACYTNKMDALFGHREFFDAYTVDDSFPKNRKIWPLR
jgi:hypothetical protein